MEKMLREHKSYDRKRALQWWRGEKLSFCIHSFIRAELKAVCDARMVSKTHFEFMEASSHRFGYDRNDKTVKFCRNSARFRMQQLAHKSDWCAMSVWRVRSDRGHRRKMAQRLNEKMYECKTSHVRTHDINNNDQSICVFRRSHWTGFLRQLRLKAVVL